MRGWRNESMRHSLASRGVKTTWVSPWMNRLNPYSKPTIVGMNLAREAFKQVREHVISNRLMENIVNDLASVGITDPHSRTIACYEAFNNELDEMMEKANVDKIFNEYAKGRSLDAHAYDDFANGFNRELRRLSYKYHDRLARRFGDE
jgi:hypothetical protein